MCSTLAGGYLAIAARRRLHLLMGVGAGVLLGAVFFDLLPESLTIAGEHGWSFRIVLGLVVGVVGTVVPLRIGIKAFQTMEM